LQDALKAIEARKTDAAFLAELGGFFFDELFTGDVATLYRTSLGMARGQGKRLRIRLRIGPPELSALPWEYLYDAHEQTALATSLETALVRYVPMRVPARPTAIKRPLRVLVVIANPHDLQPLDAEQEKASLRKALAEKIAQGQVELQLLEYATIARINQTIRSFQPHAFHFIGHGLFSQDGAVVVLEDEDENAYSVDERTFQAFFAGSQETRLVVLNACQTATISTNQPLVGLAPRLLHRRLSAVVAMQYPILDKAALIFAREFYHSSSLGYPVDSAISEARRGIFLEVGCDQPDWGAPVLFLRAADGQLFELAATEETAAPLDTVQGKYKIDIKGNVQGLILGDNAQVTMSFGDKPPEE
jgi:CHAT domain-containing protein